MHHNTFNQATRAFLVFALAAACPALAVAEVTLIPQELPTKLQVGYAVRVLDVNQDGQLDIAIVDSQRVLWLEGPEWREHVICETPQAKFDNVCFAPHDIDGDGRIDFALGASRVNRSTACYAQLRGL